MKESTVSLWSRGQVGRVQSRGALIQLGLKNNVLYGTGMKLNALDYKKIGCSCSSHLGSFHYFVARSV